MFNFLELDHPSATPSLLTATHVGIDGYPHLPRHTMPNHTELCALVRFALRTVLATKFSVCTTTASAASSVPVRRRSCVMNMSI
jgi:hypothetical protein